MSVLWWFLVGLHLSILQGWVAAHGWPWIDAGAALALFLGFHARIRAIPALLVAAGVARGVLLVGGPALHVLALGIPVAVLLPMRAVFFRRQPVWQVVAAAFLVVAVPRVGMFLAGLLQRPPPPPAPGAWHVLAAAVLVPAMVAVLMRLPPLRPCVEGVE